MANRFVVDGTGVKFILGTDTAELEQEIAAEAARAKAAESALSDRINQHGQEGHSDAIAELDVQGLDIITNTFGGDSDTQQIGLPSLVHDVERSATGLTVTTRTPTGAETTKDIDIEGSAPTATVAAYTTPADSADQTLTIATANVPVFRNIALFTGDDVAGRITKSVVGGVARATIGVAGAAVVTWMDEIQVNGRSGDDATFISVITQYNSQGTAKRSWFEEHEVVETFNEAHAFPFTVNTGLIPVDVGDYFTANFAFNSPDDDTPASFRYRINAQHVGINKRFEVILYDSCPVSPPIPRERFTDLTDTPASYQGQAGHVATVKAAEDGIAFSRLAPERLAEGTAIDRTLDWSFTTTSTRLGNQQTQTTNIAPASYDNGSGQFSKRGFLANLRAAYSSRATGDSFGITNARIRWWLEVIYPPNTMLNGNAIQNISIRAPQDSRGAYWGSGAPLSATPPTEIIIVPGTALRVRREYQIPNVQRGGRLNVTASVEITGSFFPADATSVGDIRFTDLNQTPGALGAAGQQLVMAQNAQEMEFIDQYPAGSITPAALDADTTVKQAAFRNAIGSIGDETEFLADDADFNSLIDDNIYVQTSALRLTNSPFAGPLLLLVQPVGDAAPFSLKQQVWSLSAPGLYAERQLINQSSKPTTITLTWRIHHARAQLPATLAAASSVIVEGLEDDSARWTAAPIEATFSQVGSGGTAYLSASPNSHGFVQIATSNVPFMSRHSGYSEAAAYGPLFVELADSAFQAGSADDYLSGATFHYRRAGLSTAFSTVGMSVRVDGQGFIIFASAGNVTIPTGQDLEVYFSYVSASQQRETVPIPGTYQPEGVRLSRFSIPMANGRPDYLDQDAVDARVQALRPEEFTTALKNKLVGLQQGLLAAQLRAFALAATSDADARTALQALLPGGISHQATPVTALPDIRGSSLGDEVYLISDTTAAGYGVVDVEDSGTTGLRGWFRGSYGSLDDSPEGLNMDALLAYDQSYSGTGASELRGSVFFVRGAAAGFPDAVEIDGTRTELASSSPSGFARYRQVGALVSTGLPNGVHTLRVFDGQTNRYPDEDLESGTYRADTERLRWRALAGQYTRPEIEDWFHEFARATFTGTIPRQYLPSVSQADATPTASFTSTGNRLTAITLSNAANLGDTGSIAIFKFETATDAFTQQFEVIDGKWMHFSIAYGSGSVYGVRLRSRVTENDIALERTSSGAFLNGTYSVSLV